MDDADHGVHVNLDHKAHRTLTKPAAVTWPLPIDRRLDQLVEQANEAGADTTRTELLAAVVAGTTANGDELLQLVVQWRRSSVREVVLGVNAEADVIYLPRYRPGRRKVPPTDERAASDTESMGSGKVAMTTSRGTHKHRAPRGQTMG